MDRTNDVRGGGIYLLHGGGGQLWPHVLGQHVGADVVAVVVHLRGEQHEAVAVAEAVRHVA
eukprot:6109533-Pyramimonas_sp.AAC.1